MIEAALLEVPEMEIDASSSPVRQFPGAFAAEPSKMRPLKLGILRDIFAYSVISHRRIAAALRREN